MDLEYPSNGFQPFLMYLCHIIPPILIQTFPNATITVYPLEERVPINPCHPSPCGPNSVCQPQNLDAICSCLPNYIGRPPNCRPECTMDADCPTTLACICDKCQSPCNGACAPNAHCTVLYHRAHCACDDGYTGDPYTGCSPPILRKNLAKFLSQ